MTRKLNAFLFFSLFYISSGWGQPAHTHLRYSDMLDNGSSTALGEMVNSGGKFISGKGWQAVSQNSQLKITLPEGLPFEGTFIINVTNFDPVSQNLPDDVKQHIVNMYSQGNGNKDIFETDGAWWNIRTGMGYSTGEGMAGFKFLSAPRGIDSRDEERCMESSTWRTNRVYELKVIWTQSKSYFFVDGVQQSELPFQGQVEPFRYIFIGKDNLLYGYAAQPGPIYFNLRIYLKDELPQAPFDFTDITGESGTGGFSASGYGRGVSFTDVNLDGSPDIFVSNANNNSSTPDLLYLNYGSNLFQEEAVDRGVSDEGLSHSIVNADFDNDGDLDAFFANMPANDGSSLGRNTLYRNEGEGYFSNFTDSAGIAAENNTTRGAIALDIDNDGDLDLFAANWAKPNEMYLNDGSGKMTRVHRGADGIEENSALFGRQGVAAADFDNDGDVDIYVCRRREGTQPAPNWLFVNDGAGQFSEEAAARGVAVDGQSNGAAFADVDRDGDLDLFVVQTAAVTDSLPKLGAFLNRGDGTFEDRTNVFDITMSGYSLVFGDIDNDSDPDLYLICNDETDTAARPKLYLNDGAGHFAHTACPELEVIAKDARGCAYGDIDLDGDIDFYLACNKGTNFLLRNDLGNSNHYIDVLCRGPKGDYGGFGSRVSIYQAGHIGDPAYLLGYQESVSNFGYMSQNQPALHFGLGQQVSCDVRIDLTDGQVYEYPNVSADQTLAMKEKPALLLAYVSGDNQTGFIERTLNQPLVVKVTDSEDGAQSGVSVTFVVTQGGGSTFEAQPVLTDEFGIASSHLILGKQAGENLVEARCQNAQGSPVLFSATASVPPVYLTKLSGDNQTGTVAHPLADSVVVQASNPDSWPAVNYPVVFTVQPGNGNLDGVATRTILTNSMGQAAVRWTLGSKVGTNRISAASADSTAEFAAEAIAGNPATLQKVGGDDQQPIPGQAFPEPFVVKVADQFDNPVAGQAVNFAVASGGGKINGDTVAVVITNQAGLASVNWTAGPYLGPENILLACAAFNGAPLQDSPCEWLYEGVSVDPDKSSLSATGPVKADGISQAQVIVELRDQSDAPLPGLTVRFIVSGLEPPLPIPEIVTNTSGRATASFASTKAGTFVAKAMVLGLNLMLADSAVVVFEPLPQVPDSIVLVSGNNQTGVVGTTLPQPLVVRVLDKVKQPVKSYPVRFAVVLGGGSLAGKSQFDALTDSSGLASAALTLGTVAGHDNNVIEVRVDSAANSPVIYFASAAAGEAITLEKVAGDKQVGYPSSMLPTDLVVKAKDQFSNPVEDTPIVFSPLDGGQLLTPQPVLTDSNGLAGCYVVLGPISGVLLYHFEARLPNGTSAIFSASAMCCDIIQLVSVSPDTQVIQAGSNQGFELKVWAVDPYLNPARDTPIIFSLIQGNSFWTSTTILTGSDGIATCQITTVFDQGVYTFQAKHDSSQLTFTIIALAAPNHAPEILAWQPPNDEVMTAHYGERMDFKITHATDADGDSLFFSWWLDHILVGNDTSFSFIPNVSLPSRITVTGIVHDKKDSSFIHWQVKLQSTLVELSSFIASFGEASRVCLAWQVRSESDLSGFNVLRSRIESGLYEKINSGLIVNSASGQGKYAFEDREVHAGARYYYKLEEVSRYGQTALHGPVSVSVALPERIVLLQNYPNPFNPTTNITFELPERMTAAVHIYNLNGQLVSVLAEGEMEAGYHSVVWSGLDSQGQSMPSGVYYYRLEAGHFVQLRKLVLMK
jgi:hypothetical protein